MSNEKLVPTPLTAYVIPTEDAHQVRPAVLHSIIPHCSVKHTRATFSMYGHYSYTSCKIAARRSTIFRWEIPFCRIKRKFLLKLLIS